MGKVADLIFLFKSYKNPGNGRISCCFPVEGQISKVYIQYSAAERKRLQATFLLFNYQATGVLNLIDFLPKSRIESG